MTRSRRIVYLATSLAAIVAILLLRTAGSATVGAQQAQAPMFEVDPLWPQPMPNHWLLGSAVGTAIDSRGSIHVVHLTDSFNARTEIGAATDPPTGDCCLPAPHVLVFAPDGSLARHWGGPGAGREWPRTIHRIAIDNSDNVWIGGVGEGDDRILRFDAQGRFLGRFDGRTASPTSVANAPAAGFNRVASISLDPRANEAYVADAGNRRVVVIDMNTGAIKRAWGAYGEPPAIGDVPAYDPAAPPARQFRNVFCAEPSNDGHVYVCDRESNRIQVFRRDGTFVREKVIKPATRGEGSVWDIALSHDPQQRFLYVADGSNMRVHILDRQSLELLTSFGKGGRQPGQFFAVHSLAVDAQGNLYTTETYQGKRVQKFVFRGIGAITSVDQGVLWPRR